jgi:hypothetical protein
MYLGLAVLIFAISKFVNPEPKILRVVFNTTLIFMFMGIVYLIEKPRVATSG